MIDITMCRNNSCIKFDTCYRGQSEPHPMFQEWLNVTDNENCPFFIEIKRIPPLWEMQEEDINDWEMCEAGSDMQDCDEEWGSLPWEE